MKWETDLIRDIRFSNTWENNLDDYRPQFGGVSRHLSNIHNVDEDKINGTFSECNKINLLNAIQGLGDKCRCIVEIGVDRVANGNFNTSTRAILERKLPNTIYLGIDLEDKTYIVNHQKNIHFLRTDSSETSIIIEYLNSIGIKEIDFLFIDGFHSVNQVYRDWELTKILSKHGIVAIHDTAYHPGPNLFVNNLDETKWDIIKNSCDHSKDDYGIGFIRRKHV